MEPKTKQAATDGDATQEAGFTPDDPAKAWERFREGMRAVVSAPKVKVEGEKDRAREADRGH